MLHTTHPSVVPQDDELLNIEQGYCSAIRRYSPQVLNARACGTPQETAKTLVRRANPRL